MGPTRLPGAQIRWCSLMLRPTTRARPKNTAMVSAGPHRLGRGPVALGSPPWRICFLPVATC